jgi:hypothetical protein
MRVKAPSAGICTFSALLESECFLFSSPKPTPTDASSRHHFPICRPRHSDDSFPCSPTARSACRAITRGSGGEQPTHIYSIPTSAMRVKAPSAGFCTFSALLESECSLFSKTTPNPTLRAATIFRSAGRDLRNKRSPRHAERAACRAITRGSGGEQPTHIYYIPTSAMRVKAPSAGICTFSALLEIRMFFSSPKPPQNRRFEPPPFSYLPAAPF